MTGLPGLSVDLPNWETVSGKGSKKMKGSKKSESFKKGRCPNPMYIFFNVLDYISNEYEIEKRNF